MRPSEYRLPVADLLAIEGVRAALNGEIHFPLGEIDRLIQSIGGCLGDAKMATSLVNGLAVAAGFGEDLLARSDDASCREGTTRHG